MEEKKPLVKKSKKFYKVQVELGHLGNRKSIAVYIYVAAKDILKALDYARKLPGVKHTKLTHNAVEITKEEYKLGRVRNEYHNAMNSIFNGEEI